MVGFGKGARHGLLLFKGQSLDPASRTGAQTLPKKPRNLQSVTTTNADRFIVTAASTGTHQAQ